MQFFYMDDLVTQHIKHENIADPDQTAHVGAL